MCHLISRHAPTGRLQHRWVTRFCDIDDLGLTLLERGDVLVHIAVPRGEYPVDVSDLLSAKRSRDHYARNGIRYEPIPVVLESALGAGLTGHD
jgi:hypothetical protein